MLKRVLGILAWAVLSTGGSLSAAQWGILNGYKSDVDPKLHATVVAAVATETAVVVATQTPMAGPLISTVAGNGMYGYAGDNGPATSAEISDPIGLAVDGSGNVYFTDNNTVYVAASLIRKVSPSGTMTTVAGSGVAGCNGDGGPATAANICTSAGLAVDSANAVYFADFNYCRVRKVDASGNISTIAGNGLPGFAGDGGAATLAALNYPYAVAVDSSFNVYVADKGNHRVRKISAGNISTYAGNGTSGYSGDGGYATLAELANPAALAVDPSGNLYVGDSGCQCVRIVKVDGSIDTFAGNGNFGFSGDGGPATAAELSNPQSLAVDNEGVLYIADAINVRVRKVVGGDIYTVAGSGNSAYSGDGGPAVSAGMTAWAVGVHDLGGSVDLFISDGTNYRIRKVH